jgi:hypothetical protein
MISFDTNIVVHSANGDSADHERACEFLQMLSKRDNVIDIRLGLTLRHFGVDQFATTNPKDFQSLGFQKVWNPLAAHSSGVKP